MKFKLKIKVHPVYFRLVIIYIVTDFLVNQIESIDTTDFITKSEKINLPILNSILNSDYKRFRHKRIETKLIENLLTQEQTTYLEQLIKQKLIEPLKKYHLSSIKFR